MTTGTVKYFRPSGTGCITSDDGKEVSVHFSDIITTGFKELSEGQRVKYEIEEGSKESHARNIEVI